MILGGLAVVMIGLFVTGLGILTVAGVALITAGLVVACLGGTRWQLGDRPHWW